MSNPNQTSIDEKYSGRGENTLNRINKFRTVEERTSEFRDVEMGGGLKKY